MRIWSLFNLVAHYRAWRSHRRLRKGILTGDVLEDVYEGEDTGFPLDFLAPGTEKRFVSWARLLNGWWMYEDSDGNIEYYYDPHCLMNNRKDKNGDNTGN